MDSTLIQIIEGLSTILTTAGAFVIFYAGMIAIIQFVLKEPRGTAEHT